MTVTASWLLAAEAAAAEIAASTGSFTPGRDLLLQADGDLYIGADLAFVSGLAAVAQELKLRLTLFLGEWYKNVDDGVDWNELLGVKTDIDRIYSIFRSVMLSSYGVTGIVSLEVTHDEERNYQIVYEVTSNVDEETLSDSLVF